MNIKLFYICEGCATVYSSEKKALDCEYKHDFMKSYTKYWVFPKELQPPEDFDPEKPYLPGVDL